MSFWNTSTGESAVTNSTSFEIEGGGNFEPIPDGTKVLAICEGASKRKVYEGEAQYAELKWAILKPEAYKNRKIFQKVWCYDLDPSAKDAEKAKVKRDKALKMLATIDSNAGGKLAAAGVEPTSEALAFALTNKTMVLGLNTWEIGDAKGNWVYYVGPKNDGITSDEEAQKNKQSPSPAKPQSAGMSEVLGGDDIPF